MEDGLKESRSSLMYRSDHQMTREVIYTVPDPNAGREMSENNRN
jgi:hypothetical protein